MELFAQDIMTSPLITVKPTMMCEEAAQLLVANHISGAPVVNHEGIMLGVVTLRDLIQAEVNFPFSHTYFEDVQLDKMFAERGFHLEVETEGSVCDVMTRNVYTAHLDTPVSELAKQMLYHTIHRLIIVDEHGHRPIGMVTTFDLMKVLAECQSTQELETFYAMTTQ